MLVALLALIALASLLALGLASTAIFHLDLASTDHARQRAHEVAESALGKAAERLLTDPTFGKPGDSVTVSQAEDVGHLQIGGKGPLASVNNLDHDTSTTGPDGQAVPASSFLLYAQGVSGNEQTVMKAVIALPQFPYAIAAAGPITSSGGLVVSADLGADNTGSIVSNATGTCITLGPDTVIAGDVDGGGDVAIPRGGVQILGSIQENQAPVTLPMFAAEAYDPKQMPGLTSSTGASGDLNITGFSRSRGSLQINNLTLSSGVLFVVGDLMVQGSIHGTGAIFSTGNVTIQHASQVQSDDVVALVSDGDVTLTGSSRDASFFQGTVVAGGSFTARHITIHGVFVQEGSQGTTTLEDVHVKQNAAFSRLQFGMTPPTSISAAGWGGWQGLTPSAVNGGSCVYGLQSTQTFNQPSGLNQATHLGVAIFQTFIDAGDPVWQFPPNPSPQVACAWSLGATVDPGILKEFVDPATNRYMTVAQMQDPTTYPFTYSLACSTQSDIQSQRVQGNGSGYASMWNVRNMQGYQDMVNTLNGLVGRPITLSDPSSDIRMTVVLPADAASHLEASVTAPRQPNRQGTGPALLDAIATRLQTLQQYRDLYARNGGSPGQTVFTVDLNQFIHPEDRARVLLWQDVSGQ
ncbi:MAG: hypothetical protein ACYCW6_14440 [Candidatus Xenobia bacterium]